MDWSPRQTFLAHDPSNLEEFEYDVDAELPLTVIQGLSSGEGEKTGRIRRFDTNGMDSHDLLTQTEDASSSSATSGPLARLKDYANLKRLPKDPEGDFWAKLRVGAL